MTRFGYVMFTYFAVMSAVITAFVHPDPRLVWNASASVPVGLYWAHPRTTVKVGDLVAVLPPKPLQTFLAERRYLPRGIPLLKRVAATQGHTVCRANEAISINGRHVADALPKDRQGRVLPRWTGCKVLGSDQIFLLNAVVPDSFDGRYFGLLPASTLRATLSPLWVSTSAAPG